MDALSRSIRRLNAVAMGQREADVLLRNCSLVSVYTNEIVEGQEIAISGGRIAYVGPDGSHTAGGHTRIMDLGGRYAAPGFADPHTHVDQFVTPSELAKKLLLCGTTSVFSDPIDATSVGGYAGFREFVRLAENLPVRFFHVVPGGLPVDPGFSGGRRLGPAEERLAMRHPDVLGLGEVFSWTKVTSRDPATLASISAMLDDGCVINGHTAGASGKKLAAYVSSGILSCHEPIDFEQVLERLRLGMWIMMREGSIRRDLKNIIPGLLRHGTPLSRLMFCSDGLDPADIEEFGHMDHCIREAVRLGVGPTEAITMASRNCFDYYNMGRDLGGIAPGRLADILVLDDLESFRPRDVLVGGRPAVLGGKLIAKIPRRVVRPHMRKTVRHGRFTEADFAVRARQTSASVNTIFLLTEIITKRGSAELPVRGGLVQASGDVWKVAAFERILGTGRRAVGFLENFGAEIGAFASTWSFHENDLIVIGSNDRDMAAASNALAGSQGGMAVASGGKILSHMPLQFGGIASTDPFEKVAAAFASLTVSMVDAGCRFKRPHLVPLFLPFLALPSIRITSGGMIDVKNRSRVRAVI